MPISQEDVLFLKKHGVTRNEFELINFLEDKSLETDEVASFLGVTVKEARRILTKLAKQHRIRRKEGGKVKWTKEVNVLGEI